MKLPNGAEISARQYIQEIVFPLLPKNGVVILDNGGVLSVKQFIEECVMYECQEKYNGDFPRYMAEKTRNNLGYYYGGKGDSPHYLCRKGKEYAGIPKTFCIFYLPQSSFDEEKSLFLREI